MNLLEPLALLRGADAASAVAAGAALPLRGGMAFALARLNDARVVRAADLAGPWLDVAAGLAVEPDWIIRGPSVMGVLNVTPDSFSDGGRWLEADAAIRAGQGMLADGAAILDIGGESTRPGAAPVALEEEQRRILPVIAGLKGALISVDTRNAATMHAALGAGAVIVNDVSALSHDPDAAAVVAEADCPVILMHMRGTPATMAREARYTDLAVEVTQELAVRIAFAEAAGIRRERIAIDPGFGFAKEGLQNVALLQRLPLLFNLGRPLVVGVSRKRFIGHLGGPAAALPQSRVHGSIAAAILAVSQGSCVIRVHDVAETASALRVWTALSAAPMLEEPP